MGLSVCVFWQLPVENLARNNPDFDQEDHLEKLCRLKGEQEYEEFYDLLSATFQITRMESVSLNMSSLETNNARASPTRYCQHLV